MHTKNSLTETIPLRWWIMGEHYLLTMFIYVHNAGLPSANTRGKIMLMAGMSSRARNVKTRR